MLEVKSQRKTHEADDTTIPQLEVEDVNDDSYVVTGKPILVLIFVSIRLGSFNNL